MTVTPHPPFDSGENLIALCVAREARNCIYEAKLGIVWTLRNRVAMSPAQGFKGLHEEEILGEDDNILKPWAFSSFNYDPNPHGNGNWYPVAPDANGKFPADLNERLAADKIWLDCLRAVREGTDPAVTVPPAAFYRVCFYYSAPLTSPPHAWGPVLEASSIGGLHFCTIADEPRVVS